MDAISEHSFRYDLSKAPHFGLYFAGAGKPGSMTTRTAAWRER